jgi:hypothetical protein
MVDLLATQDAVSLARDAQAAFMCVFNDVRLERTRCREGAGATAERRSADRKVPSRAPNFACSGDDGREVCCGSEFRKGFGCFGRNRRALEGSEGSRDKGCKSKGTEEGCGTWLKLKKAWIFWARSRIDSLLERTPRQRLRPNAGPVCRRSSANA